MAYDTDLIFLGDRTGKRQAFVDIPGKAATGKGGVLVLSAYGSTTETPVYFFSDSSGNLRVSTTKPTNTESDGSTVASGSGGANTALSNLASVAVNTALLPVTTAGNIDLGSTTKQFRTAYLGTSPIKSYGTTYNTTLTITEPSANRVITFSDPGGADGMVYLAATQDITGKTYNGLTVAASANTFTLTRGTASISLAEGNTDIALGAAAQLDIAAAKTVNIDVNVTANTEDITLNQSVSTTDAVTFTTITGTTFTDGTATLTAGALTCRGITNTVSVIDSTVAIQIGADNVNMTFGADDATDSKIYFNGSHLCFQDSTGGPYTLQTLATGTTLNPTVVGDLTISDGKFTWTNAADEANNAVWTFAGTNKTDIAIVSSITTGTSLSFTADACANGKILYLDSDGDVGASGYYIYAYDGSAPTFTVGADGATIIAGNASGTDALTLTAGDIKLTSGLVELTLGNVLLTDGKVTADTIQDITSYVKRNNATSTAAVVEIEQTHTGATGSALLVDQNATGNAIGLEITHDGDLAAIDLTAGAARTGPVINVVMANQLNQRALYITGAITGQATYGTIDVNSSGVLAADASLLKLTSNAANTAASFLADFRSSGNFTNSTNGMCLHISESGTAAGTSYAAYAESTANRPLGVYSMATGTPASKFWGIQAQATSIVEVDGTTGTGWVGAANVGALHITGKVAFADVAASLLYIANGTAAINDSRGHCLRIIDSSSVAGTMGYPVFVQSNDAQMGGVMITTEATATALAIPVGKVNIDTTINHSGIMVHDGTPDEATAVDAALSVATAITHIDTTVGACASQTLADGAEGQEKFIVMTVDNGDATVTPTNLFGAINTIKFTAIGQSCHLLFTGGSWVVMGYYGVTLA